MPRPRPSGSPARPPPSERHDAAPTHRPAPRIHPRTRRGHRLAQLIEVALSRTTTRRRTIRRTDLLNYLSDAIAPDRCQPLIAPVSGHRRPPTSTQIGPSVLSQRILNPQPPANHPAELEMATTLTPSTAADAISRAHESAVWCCPSTTYPAGDSVLEKGSAIIVRPPTLPPEYDSAGKKGRGLEPDRAVIPGRRVEVFRAVICPTYLTPRV